MRRVAHRWVGRLKAGARGLVVGAKLAATILLAVALGVPSPQAHAACTDNDFINIISDIAWDCIFPISIMSIPIDFGEHPPDNDNGGVLCECPGQGIYGIGFQIGYWEPARLIDTVADAGCFPGLGMEIDLDTGTGYSGGGTLKRDNANIVFQNFHFYVMPVWGMLGMFTDYPCLSDGDNQFDIAMVSEVRPDWGNDLVAAQWYPETALMANPAAVFACIADAVAATAQRPIDMLYWCMGSWGLTYPTSGHITARDYVAANAGIAARSMYLMGKNMLLSDRATDVCGPVNNLIWTKSHWRLQETDPVVDSTCHSIGHPGLLWTYRKGPAGAQDNYAWAVYRKVLCCIVVY